MSVVHGDLMSELVKIDENILEVMRDILSLPSDDRINKQLLCDYLKMFNRREKRLFSKFPKDEDFINYFMQNLDNFVANSVRDVANAGKIISRLSTFFYSLSLEIRPIEKYSTVLVGEQLIQYDLLGEYNQKRISYSYNKNLIIRYLKYLEDLKMLGIYDDYEILSVQFLNIYSYSDLNEEYCNNDYNISKLLSVSDSDFIIDNNISNEDFLEIKNSTIISNISVLLTIFFNENNDYIDHKDAELNFKFLLSELSYEALVDFSNELDEKFDSIIKDADEKMIELISTVTTYVTEEIERKKNLEGKNSINYENMTDEEHVKLLNLVDFEKKFLSVFNNVDFNNTDLSQISNLDAMQELENDLISNINFSYITVSDFGIFLNEELPNIVSETEFILIQSRFRYLFPEYRSLLMSPSQSSVSHDLIFRNYVIDTLKEYYCIIENMDDGKLRDKFFDMYRSRFFMYPFLTKELIAFNGNHLMIESISDEMVMEVSDISNLEYLYDINEQLYKEACSIVFEFAYIDSSYFKTSYFQLRFLQFDYIIRLVDSDTLEELIGYVNILDIDFKNLLIEIINYNLLNSDYNFQFMYDNDGVKVKVIEN